MSTANCPQPTAHGLQTTAYGLRPTAHGPRTAGFRRRLSTPARPSSFVRPTAHGLRTTDYGLRTTDYGLRPTDYGLRPTAFTLVEILVVLVIIGILVALIIPAVLNARERARVIQCADHQKELSRAAIQFELNHGRFPGYAESVPGYKDSSGVAYEAGWPVVLLKLLNREEVWDSFRRGETDATGVKMAVFLCPSDGEAAGTGPGLSYVGNCGQPDGGDITATVGGQTENLGTHSDKYYPPDYAANGIFFRRYTADSAATSSWVKETIAAEDIKDGEQHTFLFSECYGAAIAEERGFPEWNAHPSSSTLAKDASPAMEKQLGFLWSQLDVSEKGTSDAVDVNAPAGINGDVALFVEGDSDRPLWIPTSYHAGGVNVTYCDGRVVFLSEEVTYKVYALQMTPNGADVFNPDEPRNLPDGTHNTAGDPPPWCREPLPKR